MNYFKTIIILITISILGFFTCCDKSEDTEVATPEKMVGTWYLIDRGPNFDSTITACEKREYLIFRDNYTAMRHQDCLPKSDTEGSWEIVDGKCMMRMKLVFQSITVSDSTEQIEFKLIESNQIKVEKQYPLFVAWGIYQKQ